VVTGLHGAASEHVRDTCMRLLAIGSTVLGADWVLEDSTTTTELGLFKYITNHNNLTIVYK
jgi:hypothetical protein